MNVKELHVNFACDNSNSHIRVARLGIDAYTAPDFSMGIEHVNETQIDNWNLVKLPNNEMLRIRVIYVTKSDRFSIDVHQDNRLLSSVVCKDLSSVFFSTKQEKTIELQVHEIEAFDISSETDHIKEEPTVC